MGLRPGQERAPYVGFGASPVTNGANVGAGTGNVFKNKVGGILNFRTLQQGPGIVITTVGDVVNIAAAAFSDIYWQNPIISFYDPTPGLPIGPAVGARYIATATANGWTINHIFEWDGAAWVDTAPLEGMAAYDRNTNFIYQFDGVNWVGIGTISALANVGAGTGLIWRDTVAGVANIKSLIAGTSIAITNNANDITLAVTALTNLLQDGSGMQVYALTGGKTAISANHTFTFDNRFTQAFWASKPVLTSGDWDIVAGAGLRGLAANNASNPFKTGIKSGELDLLGFFTAANANPMAFIVTGNGKTARLQIDNTGTITASMTGYADVVVASGSGSNFLRIKLEERNIVSFYYRAASGDPWVLIVSYNSAVNVDFQDNITLSILSSPVIAGVYNFIRELTLNTTPDCDPTVFTLTDAATIALDMSRSNNFAVTLGGNRTLGSPSNPQGDGQLVRIRVRQDGTGGRTLSYNGIFKFPNGAPVLQTTPNAFDILTFQYDAVLTVWRFISLNSDTSTVGTLTDAATIAVDASSSYNSEFMVTLGGNRTLGAPTNPLGDGQILRVRVKQDGTGGRTLAYNAIYRFPGGGTPVLQTSANAQDVLTFMYHAGDVKWDFIGMNSVTSTCVALVDAATVAVDASLGSKFEVTLGGNRQLGNPTNPAGCGQLILFRVRQDGTGTRILTYDTKYRFSTSLPSPTLSTGINKVDYLGFIYDKTADKWDFISFVKGFN